MYIDCTPTMTSDSTPGPYNVYEDSVIDPGYEGYCCFNKINQTYDGDNSTSEVWQSGGTLPHWVTLDFGSPLKKIVAYRFLTRWRTTGIRCVPCNFTFRGSTDNFATSDVLLDTQTGYVDPGANIWTPWFSFSNITAYQYYRLHVTLSQDYAAYVVLQEIQMSEAPIVHNSKADFFQMFLPGGLDFS